MFVFSQIVADTFLLSKFWAFISITRSALIELNLQVFEVVHIMD